MVNIIDFLGFQFEISPVAFTLPFGNGWSVYWYGIFIATGFILAFLYGMKRAKLLNINTDRLLDGVIITTPLCILLARAYYIVFDPDTTFAQFLNIHDGGLAIYGGIIGAVIGALISCKVRKLNLIDTLDLIAPSMFIGQAIGRWGNFFNQEAFGTNTTLPWGMYSEGSYMSTYSRILAMGDPNLNPELPVHPCFLYEFLWCTAGFFVLNYMIKRRKFKGQLALSYGIWYGIGRAIIESFRTDSLMIGTLRVSQLLSIAIALACLVIYILILKRKNITAKDKDYIPVFSDEPFSLEEVLEEGSETDSQDRMES